MGNAIYNELMSPYGKIYIHSYASDEDLDDVILALDEAYANGDVTKNALSIEVLSENLEIILTMFIILVMLLSVATLYCCFSILTAQRVGENALFAAVGSKPRTLNLISVVEMAIYWFVGSAIGIALGEPMFKLTGVIAKFEYTNPTLQIDSALEASAIMLAATEFSMLLYIAVERLKKYRLRKAALKAKKYNDATSEKVSSHAKLAVAMGLTVLFVAMFICSMTLRQIKSRIISIIGAVAGFVMMFFDGGLIFNKLSVALSGNNKLPVPLRYGIKNSGRVKSQSNAASLFSVMVLVLLLMIILAETCTGLTNIYVNMIDADYVAINATDASKNHMRSLDCVESVNDTLTLFTEGCFYPKDMTFKERPAEYDDANNPDNAEYLTRRIEEVIVLSATDVAVFTEKFGLEEEIGMPHGKNVYIAETNMARYELEIGDKVAFNYGGVWYEDLTIVGTFKASDTLVIINAEDLGISYNYTAIKGKDGVDKEELYDAVFDACNMDNVTLAEPEELMSIKIRNIRIFNACIWILLGVMFVFAVIGIADSVASGYRSRKDEFDCYAGAGMNKKAIRAMKVSETAYSFAVGLMLVAVMIGPEILLVNEIMLSFNTNIFYCL